jgi:hypothetical protein
MVKNLKNNKNAIIQEIIINEELDKDKEKLIIN